MTVWASGATVLSAGIGYASTQSAQGAAQGAQEDALMQQQMAMQQMMKMLKPYRKAGVAGLNAQLDLLGLNGTKPQQTAIDALEASPYFTSQVKAGEEALLQNASATGGLRGGNTAAALAQFRPQMLTQTIENQYGKLAALSAAGQNAAVNTGVGTQGYQNNIANIMGNIGNIAAQGAIAQGTNLTNLIGGLAGAIGQYKGGSSTEGLLGGGTKTGVTDNYAPRTNTDGSYTNLGAGIR